jgi:hypothetical protein
MGGGEPVEVGHERVPQGRGGIAHSLGKALPQQAGCVYRLLGEHTEMKHHLPRSVRRAAVMAAGFLSAVSRRAGGQQVVEVVVGQRIQPSAGLDEEPADHLGSGGAAGAFGEAQFLGGGEESGQVLSQGPRWQMTPEDGQLTADQVVIAGPQIPGQHQEHHERPGGIRHR